MVCGGTVLKGGERDSLAAEFRQIVSEITELLGKPNISDYYLGLARFDLQGVAKHMDGLVLRSDSSSNTIEFAMAELMNEPDILKKAQQELEDVIDKTQHSRRVSPSQAIIFISSSERNFEVTSNSTAAMPHCMPM
ncbi:Cytochrome P [Parasponia andersonii]|uniref:Cytochrome P n=1 Tax=Parasponia andersonii TaxID=3476 RepID=A0A2P5DDV3_PARAD|nr:Cytochrome P [Parasponia andersonii]